METRKRELGTGPMGVHTSHTHRQMESGQCAPHDVHAIAGRNIRGAGVQVGEERRHRHDEQGASCIKRVAARRGAADARECRHVRD